MRRDALLRAARSLPICARESGSVSATAVPRQDLGQTRRRGAARLPQRQLECVVRSSVRAVRRRSHRLPAARLHPKAWRRAQYTATGIMRRTAICIDDDDRRRRPASHRPPLRHGLAAPPRHRCGRDRRDGCRRAGPQRLVEPPHDGVAAGHARTRACRARGGPRRADRHPRARRACHRRGARSALVADAAARRAARGDPARPGDAGAADLQHAEPLARNAASVARAGLYARALRRGWHERVGAARLAARAPGA